ncbi:MAG TPA: glycoside hydrolase [Cytophagales bacterium]|jgi:chitinase|nr:glycoside hydrolase [Cytophagales bacterium]
MLKQLTRFIFAATLICYSANTFSQKNFNVIAYFSGKADQVESIEANKLTHIIFSFCHLKGNRLAVDSKEDSITISKLVGLKKNNPQLKVMLSLGGWSGCGPCSDVFNTSQGREDFSQSVLALNQYFKTDGIDLDWEYPSIEGYPGHTFRKEDKENFTSLVKSLRKNLGANYEISFAAGGFKKYLEESVDWDLVTPLIDRINVMSYDLVNGYSTVTGHHTPLYSDKQQPESVDFGVQWLINHRVPKNKIVIGAAFYARVWQDVPNINHGLYQSGKFMAGIDYKKFDSEFSTEKGFAYFWDEKTQAPYYYNSGKKLFATFDDKKSIFLKTKYVSDLGLQGIMFWEFTLDSKTDGLLDVIHNFKKKKSELNKK